MIKHDACQVHDSHAVIVFFHAKFMILIYAVGQIWFRFNFYFLV